MIKRSHVISNYCNTGQPGLETSETLRKYENACILGRVAVKEE